MGYPMRDDGILRLFGIKGSELESMLSLAGVDSRNIVLDLVTDADEVLGTISIRNGRASMIFGNAPSKMKLRIRKP